MPDTNSCSVEGCDKPRRSSGVPYCQKHYSRVRRHGHAEATRKPPQPATGPCPVEGCDQPQSYNGMCKKHATRVARHGDPHAFTHQRDRNLPRGQANPHWTGDDATYFAVHQRLASSKGRASGLSCVDCGGAAAQWSYDHSDAQERSSEFGPYSVDLDRYDPRCVPCHKEHDLRFIRTTAPFLPHVDRGEVRRLHAAGVRARPMSRHFGIGITNLYRIFDELGLSRFPPGNPRACAHYPEDAPAGVKGCCA
jgi:hypothetical protein